MALQNSKYGRSIGGPWAVYGLLARGSLTTALTGTNNDLKITSVHGGVKGNSYSVVFVVAGTNTPLSVSRAGNVITVNVATNGAGAATSTAAQVRDAINASDEAKHLVRAELAAGNDGTGVVTALASTPLAGGTAQVAGHGASRPTRRASRGTNANG
jgi:hypothetical protein